MPNLPKSSSPPNLFDPDEPFDPIQRAMHGVLRTYFDTGFEEASRTSTVMRQIAREQLLSRCRRAIALSAAAVALVLGLSTAWKVHSHTPELARTDRSTPVLMSLRLLDEETRTLPLEGGGSVLVRGPADLDLVTASRANLRLGRIRVRVGKQVAPGFVVDTPRGIVTDRGTEFGIEVTEDTTTGVVVFEGKVDLAVNPTGGTASQPAQELVEGEGVLVDQTGQMDRLMSIVLEPDRMFQRLSTRRDGSKRLIVDVKDNVNRANTKRLYQVVSGGFMEDCQAYVDRRYEWNGLDESGLPQFLRGADYIMTFNDDKTLDTLEITVTLGRPAMVYVLFDDRGPSPDWLTTTCVDTGEDVGLDEAFDPRGMTKGKLGRGPGNSVNKTYSIWYQRVLQPGSVVLGPRGGDGTSGISMYGIAVVPLDATETAPVATD